MANRIQLSDHFTYGKLLRFALPSVLMMVFTSIYGIVDGYFVSNFAGKTAFAAVNFIMPFLMILGALGFMVGAGGCALIGRTLGEGDREKANRIFSLLVYFTLVCGTVIALLGAFFMKKVALLLGADAEMADICVLYGCINMLGLPAVMLQYEFHSFFIVAEKPQMGLYVTLASGIMNMVLDALLTGLLGLGVVGAAAATVASQLVGGLVPLVYFSRPNGSLLRIGKTGWDFSVLARTLGNGSSEFVSSISMSVVGMLYNVKLMKYAGENGISAYGVLMYVGFIFVAIFIGYSVGTAPVVSFHFGANNTDELKNLLKKSLRIVICISLVMVAAGELLAPPLASAFVGYDEELCGITVRAMRIYSLCFLFCCLPIFGSSFFTALNDGLVSAAISFLRTVVFQVGSVLVMSAIWQLDGIWMSLVAAEIAAAFVTVILLASKKKKYRY